MTLAPYLAALALVVAFGMVVAGVWLQFGLGWALIVGAGPLAAVGVLLARGYVHHTQTEPDA